MDAEFPDTGTLAAVFTQALRAPSIHNSQPWRWRVGDSTLSLFADPDVTLPHTDPDGRDRILSCGAALHHGVVALAAAGWRAQIDRFPDPANPDHLAVLRLFRAPTTESDIALSAAIERRRTDRRRYSERPVPEPTLNTLTARLQHYGLTVREVNARTRLARIVSQSVRQHASDTDYLAELHMWSGRHASATGVPARNTLPADSTTANNGRAFAGGSLSEPHATGERDSSVVLALGTANDRWPAWLRAGEATSAILLRATMSGLASCPMTEPLEIAETREAVMREIFGGRATPQMLLRIGWAPTDAEPLPWTPRRPVEAVVRRLDGSALR
ncbi:MAG: nitroreductase family protein [Actinomycetota bacterium]|nr:nitroreductase family protein [Actinomycetota bacterium]